MSLSPDKRVSTREGILQDLYAAARIGLPAPMLLRGLVRARAITISEEELERALFILEAEGLIERRESALSKGSWRWLITGQGIQLAEREELI